MKRWILFLLLSFLLHSILVLLLGLLPSDPPLKLLQASMAVQLVSYPESGPAGEPVKSGGETAESVPSPQAAEKEPTTETEPLVEEPLITEETVPVPPEPPAQEIPKPEKPKEVTPSKPEPSPEPKPEPEIKPKPKPKPVPVKKSTPEPSPKPVSQKDQKPQAVPTASSTEQETGPQAQGIPNTGDSKTSVAEKDGIPMFSQGPAVYEIQSGDLLKKVAPRYPVLSRRRGEEGKVILLVTVRKGQVKETLKETSSGYERLDEAAIRAVKAWQFRGDLDGLFRVPVVFRLD